MNGPADVSAERGPKVMVRRLDHGERTHPYPSIQVVAMAFFLALIGAAMVIYLISVRRSAPSHSINSQEMSMTPTHDNGITAIPSNHSVDQTVEKLKGILQAK